MQRIKSQIKYSNTWWIMDKWAIWRCKYPLTNSARTSPECMRALQSCVYGSPNKIHWTRAHQRLQELWYFNVHPHLKESFDARGARCVGMALNQTLTAKRISVRYKQAWRIQQFKLLLWAAPFNDLQSCVGCFVTGIMQKRLNGFPWNYSVHLVQIQKGRFTFFIPFCIMKHLMTAAARKRWPPHEKVDLYKSKS